MNKLTAAIGHTIATILLLAALLVVFASCAYVVVTVWGWAL